MPKWYLVDYGVFVEIPGEIGSSGMLDSGLAKNLGFLS